MAAFALVGELGTAVLKPSVIAEEAVGSDGSCLISGLTALPSMLCCADAVGEKSDAVAAPADTTGVGANAAVAIPGVLADSLPGARGFPVVGVVVSLGVREPDLRDERPAGEGLVMADGLRARVRVGGVARLAAFS